MVFAHGLGNMLPIMEPLSKEGLRKKLVVLLGFAGGTPADLRKYTSRLYHDDEVHVITLCASEVPEVHSLIRLNPS